MKLYDINGISYEQFQTPDIMAVTGPGYNLMFKYSDGFTARWGNTKDDDPKMSPLGPEILDVEVSTICTKGCPWCYKSNTGCGENMSLDTFKHILSIMPPTLTQIAFGIGDLHANPDLFDMFSLCRRNRIVPNVTIHGKDFTQSAAEALASLCGAVAVSHYNDQDCFGTIEKLHSAGLKQVNIHQLLAAETFSECMSLLDKARDITGLGAIVFLSLKKKGRGQTMTALKDLKAWSDLIQKAERLGVRIGFDSCSAPNYMRACGKGLEFIEPCESGLFSFYVSADGQAYPCSFSEGHDNWTTGIDLTKITDRQDFLKNVWHNPRIEQWRSTLLTSSSGCFDCPHKKLCRSCPIYDVSACKEH